MGDHCTCHDLLQASKELFGVLLGELLPELSRAVTEVWDKLDEARDELSGFGDVNRADHNEEQVLDLGHLAESSSHDFIHRPVFKQLQDHLDNAVIKCGALCLHISLVKKIDKCFVEMLPLEIFSEFVVLG